MEYAEDTHLGLRRDEFMLTYLWVVALGLPERR